MMIWTLRSKAAQIFFGWRKNRQILIQWCSRCMARSKVWRAGTLTWLTFTKESCLLKVVPCITLDSVLLVLRTCWTWARVRKTCRLRVHLLNLILKWMAGEMSRHRDNLSMKTLRRHWSLIYSRKRRIWNKICKRWCSFAHCLCWMIPIWMSKAAFASSRVECKQSKL